MRRPVTITVVACFLFFATVIATVTAVALLWPGTPLDVLWRLNPDAQHAFSTLGRLAGILLLVLGVATLCAGIALLRRRFWAWWFSVALFAVNGLGDLLSMFRSSQRWRTPIGLLVAGIFLYFLTRPRARDFFAAGAGNRRPAGGH